MNDLELERNLRAGLTRAVESAPPLPRLTDEVVRRGRHARRRRVAGAAAAVAAVAAAAVVVTVPPLIGGPDARPAAVPTGPPAVPLWVAQDGGRILDQYAGALRSRPIGTAVPIAAVPSGILLDSGGSEQPYAAPSLQLLGPDDVRPRTVVADITGGGAVAVAADGGRAVVVTGAAQRRELREVDVPSGRQVRSVPIAPPLAGPAEAVRPVGYAGGAVLLTIGEGAQARAAVWEAGDDQVIGPLSGRTAAVEGATRDGTGLLALRTDDDRCGIQVVQLLDGGPGWRLCREPFAGFAPDGGHVLATNAVADGIVVRDSRSGDEVFRHDAGRPLRAYGWESAGSVLYTAAEDGDTVVTRCVIATGDCSPVLTVPGTDTIPQPVPRRG